MRKIIILLALTTYSSSVFSVPLTELPDGPKTSVLEFLDPDDLLNVRKTNKSLQGMLGPNSYIRQHMFDVTLSDSSKITLREYLQQQEREQISEVKNLVTLLKDSPNAFISLMMKSIPHAPETIESLRTFHQDTFQIDNLTSSLPVYETSQQKLAGVLIELLTWAKVRTQVEAQFWDQVVRAQVRAQVWAQVGDQVRTQVWTQVEAQVGEQVWTQDSDQVDTQVRDQVRTQVEAQVWDQVIDDLRNFASAFEEGNLNEVKPAIDYVFTVYQLGTLAIRHSEAFKAIHRDLSQFISERITEEQARAILNEINIPDAPDGNYLIDTQLKLIKRLLPVAE